MSETQSSVPDLIDAPQGERRDHPRRATIRLGLLTVAVAALVGLAFWAYLVQYRPDKATGLAAEKAAISAATEGSVALLSYAPASLDHDIATAKSHLTGEFLTTFSTFSDQIVAPAAKQNAVTTSATVARAAVTEIHPDRAVVLLFINQTTTSAAQPNPVENSSSVVVTLNTVNGSWLIARFEPV